MITGITVLYDSRCPTCVRARAWLEARAQLVPLRFVPAGSAAAPQCFPDLDHARTLDDITVIGDDGQVFGGPKAWVVCLWALRDCRALANALSTPALYPLARRVVGRVSRRVADQRARPWPLVAGPRCEC